MSATDPRVIVALDYSSAEEALALVEQLNSGQCRLKVGKELFTSAGPQLVKALVDRNFKVFLDLSNTHQQHVLGEPSLVSSHHRGDAEREGFFGK